MRKLLCLILALCLTLPLAGCGRRTANTEEEMLGIITKELDSDVSLQTIGTIELDEVVLVCYMTGNEYQAHSYGYAEFSKRQKGYEFLRTYSMMQRGMDLRSALYHDTYLFVSNNEKSKSLRIRFQNGKEELISVDKIPFIYHLENASNFEYTFLDAKGKALWP